jgi:hypothetical protein
MVKPCVIATFPVAASVLAVAIKEIVIYVMRCHM